MADLMCQCGHRSHYRKMGHCNTCRCMVYKPTVAISQPFVNRPANDNELIQYTADQLNIPYRVSKSDREYCVYYFGSGKELIELIIMSNLTKDRITVPDNVKPWYVTWTTPTTTHKETLAKFTDLLLLIQLLQEGVNAKTLTKATAHK